MDHIVLVAGATGDLGGRIVKALLKKNIEVRAVVRASSSKQKISDLEQHGVKIYPISNWSESELSIACKDATCVVSALAGLQEVIIDAQTILVKAAIAAGVPRFIPSDFSLDFTRFRDGENRNLDLRRKFHKYLDSAPIASTSIFNSAFTDLLKDQMPLILYKKKMVLFWGKADNKWDFTTMDDTAAYTAHAAVDPNTPRYLRIAGDQVSPKEIRQVMNDLTGEKFRLLKIGGQGLLKAFITIGKTLAPSPNDLYPAWQGMQYMHNMIDSRAKIPQLDNDRYPAMQWTSVKEYLSSEVMPIK